MEFDEEGRIIVREEEETAGKDENEEKETLEADKIPLRGPNRTSVKVKKVPNSRVGNGKIRGEQDGSMFRATRARGDMKKGKLQPYAYIKLDSRMLSKKKQNQALGKFNNLIGAAKRGAKEGFKKRN